MKNFLIKLVDKFKKFFETIKNYVQGPLRLRFTKFITDLIPDKDITKTSILFYFIISFCTIAIIWGFVARIDMVVRAVGEVIPATKIKVVQSVFGGVIESINIELGDKVKKGDTLFIIDGVKADAEYQSNERVYEATILEVETLQKRVDLISDLVDQGAESEMRLLDEKLRLVDSKRRLAQAESIRGSLKQQIDQTTILAPYDGTINDVYITSIGEVVQSAQLLANLVPEDEKLIIQVQVQPKDISFVQEGQKAKIGFSAYDPAVYGTFEGKVFEVGITTTKGGDKDAPNVYYDTRIEVTDEEIRDISIQSGMQVDVSIIGQKRTVFGYIFSPVTKLKRQAFREK